MLRAARKLDKLRADPKRFLAESRYGLLRRLALSELVQTLERDPWDTLRADPLSWMRGHDLRPLNRVGQVLEDRSRRQRAALLEEKGRPRVSVIVPVCDAGDTIQAALASVREQSYSNLEIVVVDDGSSDGTASIVEQITRQDPRVVRLATGRTRSGAAYARNVGLRAATGHFVTFQDADDYSHPDRIAIQLTAFFENDSAIVCTADGRREDPHGDLIRINGHGQKMCVPTMLFPLEPVAKRLGYMRALRTGEDTEYLNRIMRAFPERRHVRVRRLLYRARFDPNSLSHRNSALTRIGPREIRHVPRPEDTERLRAAIALNERVSNDDSALYVAFWPPGDQTSG